MVFNHLTFHDYAPSVHEEEILEERSHREPSLEIRTPLRSPLPPSPERVSRRPFSPYSTDSTEPLPPPQAVSPAHLDIVPAAEQHDPPSIRCSEDFFLEDASLVLISDENVAFGVHRSVLRRHSTVFHDMFEILKEVPESEMFEGLPFVRLHDSMENIKTFLQIVYDQKPVESIEAPHKILAFCDKYAFDFIVKKILAMVSQTFPDTLEAWNRPRDDEQIKEAVNVAIAASRLGMKIFIPASLYTIMSSIYERDLLQKLPQPLLLQFHHGFAEFSTYAIDFYRSMWMGRTTPPRGCHKKAKCKDAWSPDLRSLVEQTFLHEPSYIRYPQPLAFLQRLSNAATSMATYNDFCTKCQVSLSDVFENAQRDVWNSLPKVFKVADSWEELRQINV